MESSFLTIKEAAAFIGKAEVTIRRLLKRLLKNRTSETDRCIIESTEHGKRLYRIEARFLVEHANLNAATRERLRKQLDQMDTKSKNDQPLSTQETNSPSQLSNQSDSGSTPSSTQTDHKTTQMNNSRDQTPSQKNTEQPIDNANDQSSVNADTQVTNQNSDFGSGLLKDAWDELRSQLRTKDDQIKEKDQQIAKRDKQIEDLGKSVDKLTSAIEQGNFLVASAQQRIPLPDDSKRETIPNPNVIQVGESDSSEIESEPEATKSDVTEASKRGLWQSITARFQRSDK